MFTMMCVPTTFDFHWLRYRSIRTREITRETAAACMRNWGIFVFFVFGFSYCFILCSGSSRYVVQQRLLYR